MSGSPRIEVDAAPEVEKDGTSPRSSSVTSSTASSSHPSPRLSPRLSPRNTRSRDLTSKPSSRPGSPMFSPRFARTSRPVSRGSSAETPAPLVSEVDSKNARGSWQPQEFVDFDIDSLGANQSPTPDRLSLRSSRASSRAGSRSGSRRNSLGGHGNSPLPGRRRLRGREKNVLCVQPSTLESKLISVSLTQLGFHVACVATGEDAVESFSRQFFDCILLDPELPVRTGRLCCRLIRNIERQKGLPMTPIFALTRQVDEASVEKDNQAGMSGCIEKGAILGQCFPRLFKHALQKPDVFQFMSSSNQLSVSEGLSTAHVEQRTALTLSNHSTPNRDRSEPSSPSVHPSDMLTPPRVPKNPTLGKRSNHSSRVHTPLRTPPTGSATLADSRSGSGSSSPQPLT